jgi:hypothetical protein
VFLLDILSHRMSDMEAAPQGVLWRYLCAGINRHEVEDERALRGRPSEPPRPRVLREPYREVGREA